MHSWEVFIVEDDIRIAEINRKFVEKVPGFSVCGIALNEDEAKEQIAILKPDLVLLDIFFPDMNGLDFLRWIRSEFRGIEVIMVTAATEVDTLKHALSDGVFDYIVKPVIFQRFKDTLLNFHEYKKSILQLSADKEINQNLIDSILKREKAEIEPSYLPKGIDPITLEKVISMLTQYKKGYTAEVLGERIGTSRTTARRYLEYLVSEQKATADISYGGVGRPERIYKYGNG
ncbi:response regulator [Fictibacillus barbaricus]|uniref:Transcriptional regulatory protein n=1 Tax=Fictibacillus barbaricus TaxID=182136 RepID=A0ABS2ZBG6_9BACL|nr:response regulator [Fictibacillus barbaricus]MBN3545549.1 response regulator [Fictibacillus barbaricus]GGB54275.1 two-component system response regulator [Fictibacillus barbaricus]